ncbi:MAG: hypothetical protein MUE48_04475 [Desulfobacterales bacterium]|nr:hypothetical protein [Desulfobacterales bacterium]
MSSELLHSPEKLLARIEYLEENRRFIQNVLESALSLVDFQENILTSTRTPPTSRWPPACRPRCATTWRPRWRR